jgi:carotenoid cleavage dioxygenase-like enzyme
MDICADLKGGFEDNYPEVYRFSMNRVTGEAVETCLLPGRSSDFPVVPTELLGSRMKYCYAATASKIANLTGDHEQYG